MQVFCPGRDASERVQRRCAGFGTDKTDRSRASSARIEILTDIDPQLSILPWFHRSTQVRSAWRDGADGFVAAARFADSHPAPNTSRPSAMRRADAVQRLTLAC